MSLITPRMMLPRAKRLSGSSTVTPGTRLYAGKIVDLEPSTISVPPSFTNS
jgi:hypothetical protein